MTAPSKKAKRQRITDATWREMKAAFFVGGELRALAREAGISESTVLHKAMRDGWTEQRRQAHAKARQTRQGTMDNGEEGQPHQSLSIAREGLLERHLLNMLAVAGRLSDYSAELPAQAAFASVRQIDVADGLARRQLGIDREEKVLVNVAAFSGVTVSTAHRAADEAEMIIE
ncbi:MAG: hypothetical protein IAE77_19475 [Prosthecobacter sp.]|jgi:hypothetical protein|uniref:hypothetical protein n=1 Tax=Prosthecobacter sp. TaxID=1965333 RepID=UPI0019DDE68E|nr:hypothetical protein [Prosthecobacter sp.]MBE2285653.1 hypothetical protein [Prosthecobacter sp.]